MKAIKQTLLALALAGAFTNANAIPVDWTLKSVFLSSDITLSYTGSFTYDADTNTYSNFNVSVLWSDINNNGMKVSQDYGPLRLLSGNANGISYDREWNQGVLGNFKFVRALTNLGGNVQLSNSSSYSDFYWLRGGYLTGVPQTPKATAVPEPEAYAMMLAGLGLVGFAARRKLS